MTSQAYPAKRVSVSNSNAGVKLMIMGSSLFATMIGWGVLAVGQIQNTVNTAQQPQPIIQSASPATQNSLGTTNSQIQSTQPSQRQVTVPNTQQTQPRVQGRTRSSR